MTLLGDSIIDCRIEHRSIPRTTPFKPVQIGCYTLALEAVSVSLDSPHRTDKWLLASPSGMLEQHAIAVNGATPKVLANGEQERTHGASL